MHLHCLFNRCPFFEDQDSRMSVVAAAAFLSVAMNSPVSLAECFDQTKSKTRSLTTVKVCLRTGIGLKSSRLLPARFFGTCRTAYPTSGQAEAHRKLLVPVHIEGTWTSIDPWSKGHEPLVQ